MKFLIALLCLAASTLHADIKQAQALYTEGGKLMAQKQYQAAIAKYEASLQAEPRYAYSYKQIGTCKYYLNDKAGALKAYETYYAAVPSDTAVKGLIDRLKGAPVGAAAATKPQTAPSSATSGSMDLWHSGFALSLGLGYNMYSMADWNAQYATTASSSGSSGGTISSGFEVGLNLGYNSNPMRISLDVDYLMASSTYSSSFSFGSFSSKSSTNINLPVLWLGPNFDYAFLNRSKIRPHLQLGVGYMMLMGAGTNSSSSDSFGFSSTGSSSYSGSGFGFKLGIGGDFAISRTFSLGLDLGYRIASVSPITYTFSNTSGGVTVTGSGAKPLQKYDPNTGLATGNMSFDYSGIHSRLGLNFVF